MSAVLESAPVEEEPALGAFEGFGIELEYAIVTRDTLDIESAAPSVLRALAGVPAQQAAPQDVTLGEFGWSNELISHVLELKNVRPGSLEGLGRRFQNEVLALERLLEPKGLRLMPSGMHPWMRPEQAQLWSHGGAPIYEAYDRLFDCTGHGWSNLQSMHVNLPFSGDAQFERLHAAARLIVPILPALCASSPFVEGSFAGSLDHRMYVYRHNADAVPEITGLVVPENYASRREYECELLEPLYQAIRPFDREGVLQHEWLNARGAIARFDRNAIELRVMDSQECPQADVALAAAAADAVRWLYDEHPSPLNLQQSVSTEALAGVFNACVRDGERAIVDWALLKALGMKRRRCTASQLWQHLADRMDAIGTPHRGVWGSTLTLVLSRGPLARRLLKAAGTCPSLESLREVYAELCDCLHEGRAFDP